MTRKIVVALVLGQLVAQLGWIDPLFIALVLLAPLVTGAVAAARDIRFVLVAAVWWSAGVGMAWSDWVVNHEDVLFHLVLSVLMPAIAALGYGAVRLARRRTRVHV